MRPQTATRHGHRQHRPGPPLTSIPDSRQFCAARCRACSDLQTAGESRLQQAPDPCSSGSHESPHLDASVDDELRDADARGASLSDVFVELRQPSRPTRPTRRKPFSPRLASSTRGIPRSMPWTDSPSGRDRLERGTCSAETRESGRCAATIAVGAGDSMLESPFVGALVAGERSTRRWTGHDRRCLCPGDRSHAYGLPQSV